MDTGTELLIVIGAIPVITLLALLGGSMAMGGMAMIIGMMSTPVGWVVLLILTALIALIGYTILYSG